MFHSIIRSHPVVVYYVLACALTWGVTFLTLALTGKPVPESEPAATSDIILANLGPPLAAVLVAAGAFGAAGIRDLRLQLLRWRVGARWWLIAVCGWPALTLVAFAIHLLAGGAVEWRLPESPTRYQSLLTVFLCMPVLALFEEVGWRGCALPALQRRFTPLTASTILGPLWACWHLPWFFFPGTDKENTPFWVFLVSGVVVSIPYTWLYNNTRSLPVMAAFHITDDYSGWLLPPGAQESLVVPMVVGGLTLVLSVVLIFAGRMTRRCSQPPVHTVDCQGEVSSGPTAEL
jgi:membrane protease YdiL (CAAX protease family)